MSNQLEFIMQLYMMNLLQQQQQLHQQQQLQRQQQQQVFQLPSPSKRTELDISSSTATTTSTILQQQQQQHRHRQQHEQHQQQHNSRTQLRKNSQNTNCSSSSSCSPNSNASPITTAPTAPSLQQLLLEQLAQPPVTPVLAHAPPSNLLLTPTTPNSTLAASLTPKTLSLAAAYASGHFPLHTLSHSLTNSQFSAGNFLQSSTVTSTPTEQSSPALAPTDAAYASTTGDDGGGRASQAAGSKQQQLRDFFKNEAADEDDERQTDLEVDDFDDDNEEEVEEEDDEQPLSSLLHGSAEASGSASAGSSSGNAEKLLMCSGVQTLENTSDSLDSSTVPYKTPTKQPADSTHFVSQNLQHNRDTSTAISSSSTFDSFAANNAVDSESSNATPLALANAILTPPSSEQLTNNTSSSETARTQTTLTTTNASSGSATLMGLSVASSLDAFLQNEENLKNLRKFSSYLECENALCRQENLREHFHCFDEPCQGKILSKKDDIIRHLKWHKKRRESLLLGFARFSAADDCEPTYGAGCAYNWKQTHYHCVYEDCPKVYVSTSDVQMHANFHRKNSEIVQEGFRRFRAHENCKIEDCPFYGKKISHYHCCREGCNHTFKNKADMDKHKTYHLKDYQLTQDGFKKILKTEVCPFEACKFSTVCNHIHCVREGCNYILHSSSQMISHKRKHDRLDGEQAYQQYKKQKDSSGEESPAPLPAPATTAAAGTATTSAAAQSSSHTSTPLSSLTADRFLSRKRGRPPKKIQLPAKVEAQKRIKLESDSEQLLTASSAAANCINSSLPPGMFPPFLSNLNAVSAAAAAAQSMQTQDPNAPNLQLTHLMALFQLQNPLFYQNLYPNGMTPNMANLLGAAVAGVMPANTALLGNLAAYGAAAASIKSEFSDKPPYKE